MRCPNCKSEDVDVNRDPHCDGPQSTLVLLVCCDCKYDWFPEDDWTIFETYDRYWE